MRKFLKRAGALLLTLSMLLSLSLPVFSAGESDTVTLTSGSNLNTAISQVKDGGTIVIDGTHSLASNSWTAHGKTVTITGGTLDASALSTFTLGDSVTFEDMTLTLKSGSTVYANGNALTISTDVTVNNGGTIYGGKSSGTLNGDTNITILSGSFTRIYGGSNGGTINGNTNLYVGGTANADCDASSHSSTYLIFGGGNNDKISGKTSVTIADSAKANYIYGGSNGTSCSIGGGTNLYFTGGNAMSLYGANKSADTKCNSNVVMTGGSIEQLFGGCEGSGLTGNVTVKALGGTVTRRIYGGCYNETNENNDGFLTSRYVNGTVRLYIDANLTVDYTFKTTQTVLGFPVTIDGPDWSIYAHSRHNTLSDTEISKIIYTDNKAYTKYNGSLKAQDLTMQLIMGSTSAADEIHLYTYSSNGATITETCSLDHTSHSNTATLALDDSVSRAYTGSPIEAAKVVYGSEWDGDICEITYSNNVNVGTATATCTGHGNTVSLDFEITKATVSAPSLSAVGESVQGQADGRISGLTTAMEYSADGGTTYQPITDTNMKFAPGTYIIRIPETATSKASAPVTVTISEGRHVIDTAALSIRFQLPESHTAESESTTLRIISTVDHLNYKKVGFQVWMENESGEMIDQDPLETNQVFTSIVGSDGKSAVTYTPSEEFGSTSAYFFTQKFNDISNEHFDKTIRIRAYVVTSDGYTVYGEQVECTVTGLLSSQG